MRDEAENTFLPEYVESGILPDNPFEVLDVERDQDGVPMTPRPCVHAVREPPPRDDETLSDQCIPVEETPR